jgi:anti-sigma regulatory factor (Ser/Thr protein kinase)
MLSVDGGHGLMGVPGTKAQHSDSARGTHLELELRATPDAPGLARAAVQEMCATNGEPGRGGAAAQSRDLVLLVSEIVTNAVLHSRGHADELHLTADLHDHAIHVAVTDSGHGFGDDIKRHAGGYGLFLLDKLAGRWGVESATGPEDAATRVWFDFDLAHAA